MNSEDIEIAVVHHFGVRANLAIPNASWGAGVHECDLLLLTQSGFLTEVEIKVSKSDLKKDAKKEHAHKSDRIRRLYFAIPETVFDKDGVIDLIPLHAGILTVSKGVYGWSVSEKREAKNNRQARPASAEERYQMARLAALRIWKLKERLQKVREAM